jgi:L-fuculose-phosphate aldolase
VSTRLEEQTRAEIVEAGRRMYARGYVASNDGNISARLDESRILTTPKSVSKGFMTPDMMVIVDYEGKKLSGDRDASSELPMHLEIYRNRPDVNAVVHAHPPLATGFAVAGIPLTRAVLAEVVTTLGSIPIAEYGTPSTAELPAAVRKYIKAHDGLLWQTTARSRAAGPVMTAYYKMETIEHFAKISLVARCSVASISSREKKWSACRGFAGMYGIAAPAPLCADPSELAATDQILCQVLEAPEAGSARLVADDATSSRLVPDVATSSRLVADVAATLRQASRDGEIRLTYGELTALIADAVKNLRE